MWILETDYPEFSLGFGSGPRSHGGDRAQKHVPCLHSVTQ